MFIRLATLSDISLIMKLIAEVVPLMNAAGNFQWDDTYPNVVVFEKDIAHNQLWVAEIDGHIAGVIAITTHQEQEYEAVGWDISQAAVVTHRLAVSPRFQGRGIGAGLMLQAEQVAVNRGINILRVDTNANNLDTQRLFPKIGYQFAGEIGLGFRPGMRFLCYEKIL